MIDECRKLGIHAGLALNPADNLERYLYLADRIRHILIMMCEPDGFGQRYQALLEDKVKSGIEMGFSVWLDGDVDWERAQKAKQNGVSAVVMGRAIFRDRKTAKERFDSLKR